MKILMFCFALLLLTLQHSVHSFNVISYENVIDAQTYSLPCPAAVDIEPCICTVGDHNMMDMDCSSVQGESQLALVFRAYFPFSNFRSLTITGNSKIHTLQNGVFGNVSFQEITVTHGGLGSVGSSALSGSYSTATNLNFGFNGMTTFPFDTLSSFTHLDYLSLESNQFKSFPSIASSTLTVLNLQNNPIADISGASLQEMPRLEEIDLSDCQIGTLSEGTFTDLTSLSTIDLSNNLLSSLDAHVIQLTHASGGSVNLTNNYISHIDVSAITGVADYLQLDYNFISELAEDVFRPMLEDQVQLYIAHNPLACSCEIAWLILDDKLLTFVDGSAACADGELLSSLDPAIFQDLCPPESV